MLISCYNLPSVSLPCTVPVMKIQYWYTLDGEEKVSLHADVITNSGHSLFAIKDVYEKGVADIYSILLISFLMTIASLQLSTRNNNPLKLNRLGQQPGFEVNKKSVISKIKHSL